MNVNNELQRIEQDLEKAVEMVYLMRESKKNHATLHDLKILIMNSLSRTENLEDGIYMGRTDEAV